MFDERAIVSSVLNGDQAAFELLVRQYERLVFFVVYRLVKEKEDQEDVAQEVFIKVYNSLPRFAFASKLSTWISRIAYLTAINHVKKYQREQVRPFPGDLEHISFEGDRPETVMDKKELAAYMDKLIAQMPIHYRTVLTLFHLNEFTSREIAEATGMAEGTVKSCLFRARKLLKEKIQRYLKNDVL